VLSGEGDADVFIFADRHGTDRIQDFTPGEDLIDLSALTGIGGIGDLRLQSDQGDTLVTTGQGGIRLEGLIPSALDGDDFIF
jgi:serralysin